jgi:hypothetical protein
MASDTARVYRSSKTAKAGLFIQESAVSIVGDKRHFIVADHRGITIRGPISMVATSESIRKGGLFVGLNDYVEQLPSTIITPLPRNIPFPPVHMVANVVKDLAFFLAFLV